jgi:hypothetical protein
MDFINPTRQVAVNIKAIEACIANCRVGDDMVKFQAKTRRWK